MGLCHGFLGTVEAVENEFAEKAEANLAFDVEVMFAACIDEVYLVAAFVARDVDVLAEFDVALGAEDNGAAVPPGAEAVGGEPVNADIVRGAVVPTREASPKSSNSGLSGLA